ncbi:MAG: hypothetical protein ABIN96_02450 [Rubrivivax sp.]
MNPLSTLNAFGITLPSPAYVLGAIVFGLIGFAAFRFGRRQGRPLTLWLGVVLMLYPYAVSRTSWLYGVGLALCIGLVADRAAERN